MASQICKILLVDDDRDILTVLKMRLELMGYEVTACTDPEEALQCYAGHELVITDQRMDKLRGVELLERLKAQDPFLPVIIMTAYGTVDDAVKAVKSGAFSYIEKPVNPVKLAELINSALEQRRLQEQLAQERELLGKAISSIGACLFLISYDRQILWANANAKKYLKTEKGPLPRLERLLEMMIEEAISSSEHKAVEFFDKERGCWYLFSATPNPRLNHVAVLAVDVTDLKKAQKTLNDRERLAGALEMAGAVAHQFSQPMQAIVLHCDLIARNGDDPDRRKEAVESLLAQVEKLGRLIREITSLTNYATMDYPGRIKILDLEKAADMRSQMARQKGLPGMKEAKGGIKGQA